MVAAEVGLEGRTFFTQVNIWYEKADAIYSTNYHAGEILPAATPVKILSVAKDRIQFSVQGKGEFAIVHIRKHNPMELNELFDLYFSVEDPVGPKGKFHTFTKEEQKHIADGTLGVGMRKEAVIMAYGHPPGHKTPRITDNTWTYWLTRFKTQELTFGKDGKLSSL